MPLSTPACQVSFPECSNEGSHRRHPLSIRALPQGRAAACGVAGERRIISRALDHASEQTGAEILMLACALIAGLLAGLRPMVPIAAVAWAANYGVLPLEGGWLAFLGCRLVAPLAT